MKAFFNRIRSVDKKLSFQKQIVFSVGSLLLGIILGTFSKYLDAPFAELPYLLARIDSWLDLHNFLGVFAPWLLIAVGISVYSSTPVRASINVFCFFLGMVSSYYLYSYYVAGFFPKSYAMIWIGYTVLSPLFAFICWYATGTGLFAVLISAGIIAVLFNLTFIYGQIYFEIRSMLAVCVFLVAIVILRRSKKETLLMIGMGIVFAFIFKKFLPIPFW